MPLQPTLPTELSLAAAIAGKRSVGLTNGLRKEWWKYLILDNHHVCYDRIHVVSNMLMLLRMLGIEPIPRVVMGYDDSDTAFAREYIPFQRLHNPASIQHEGIQVLAGRKMGQTRRFDSRANRLRSRIYPDTGTGGR